MENLVKMFNPGLFLHVFFGGFLRNLPPHPSSSIADSSLISLFSINHLHYPTCQFGWSLFFPFREDPFFLFPESHPPLPPLRIYDSAFSPLPLPPDSVPTIAGRVYLVSLLEEEGTPPALLPRKQRPFLPQFSSPEDGLTCALHSCTRNVVAFPDPHPLGFPRSP